MADANRDRMLQNCSGRTGVAKMTALTRLVDALLAARTSADFGDTAKKLCDDMSNSLWMIKYGFFQGKISRSSRGIGIEASGGLRTVIMHSVDDEVFGIR